MLKYLGTVSPSHYLRFQSLILNISADDLCSSAALWPQNPPHPYRTCHCATACVLTENQAIRAKWQFSTHLENKKKKKGSIQRQNLENCMICRAGAPGLATPLTRELNCTHRWPQHLSFVGMQSLVFTSATQFAQRGRADDKALKMDTDGSDQAWFELGLQRSHAVAG